MSFPMFHTVETGISNADYDDSHVYAFGFQSNTVQIHFRSGTGPIYYSFNGTDDHGVLNNATGFVQTQVLEPFQANRLWLRGGDGTEIVEITALPKTL